MALFRINPIVIPVSLLTFLALLLPSLDQSYLKQLTTSPNTLSDYEYWRWLTCNFVHFGWAHAIMDAIGFALVSLAFFYFISIQRYLCLLLFCCLAVGTLISVLSPDILYYAGLSGAIHGLLVAGCFYATHFPVWKRLLVFIITTGKILQEQLPGFDINPTNNFMPVSIAVDAHLIGAVAGLIFFWLDKTLSRIFQKR